MAKVSRPFQIFAKPIGSICNLSCAYCYYLDKKALYADDKSMRMPDDILRAYIVQHIEAFPGSLINFTWHGGEPTLLGLDYFRKIVDLQQKNQPPGCRIINNLQTNGVLLDDKWCRFLSQNDFSVGLSLDGPQKMHDAHRITAGGKPTHNEVMNGYHRLKQYNVPCDILCVVNAINVREPYQVYGFFKEIKAEFIGFIPLVEPRNEKVVSNRSIFAESWGEFLCTIFDEWRRLDIGIIQVQIFEEVARSALGHAHALCIFREICGDVLAIEHNGDLFSCDHFVDRRHCLGNIQKISLGEMLESRAQKSFGKAKSNALPNWCRQCDVLNMCHGGCPKDRIIPAPDGAPGLNYLCSGYKRFFRHCQPFVKGLSSLSQQQAPMEPKRGGWAADHGTGKKTARNAPCPCGSGLKYKKCCLGKR